MARRPVGKKKPTRLLPGRLYTLLLLGILVGMAYSTWQFGQMVLDSFVDDRAFAPQIQSAAQKYNVDSRLIRALIFEESRFRPGACGAAGEVGLMQLLPQGAVADYAEEKKCKVPGRIELFSPTLNIEIGTWYLSRALKRYREYDCAMELALCFYNAGPSRAEAWKPEAFDGSVIDRIQIDSTRRYVQSIMRRYRQYCENDKQADGMKK